MEESPSRLVWRTARGGAIAGLVLGAGLSCFMLVASPHVPVGVNLLVGPGLGATAGAATGALLAVLWGAARRLRSRAP